MKYLLPILLVLNISCSNQNMVRVELEVYAPNTPDSTNIYIAGNNPKMGNWSPGQIMLQNRGDHFWEISFNYAKGSSLEYKYTLGRWENEAVDEQGSPFGNAILNATQDTTVYSEVLYWKDGAEQRVPGQITGEVRYHLDMSSPGLLDRDIIVWLPPGYNDQPEKHYPVLYMHDGQNVFDPNTASAKVDWQIDESADSLIALGKIDPLIIVGIYNTVHRSSEYEPTRRGKRYRSFVVSELKPMIDKNYRTQPEKEFTLTGGSSAGGIVAFMLAWENPDVFSGAICMSPAFKIDDINYVKPVSRYKGPMKDLKFYIDNGGIGLEARLQPGIDDMLKALQRQGYEENVDYLWVLDLDAEHFESAWAWRMPLALEFFYSSHD